LQYTTRVEETAPPPELVKDIVVVTASSLTILKVLYDFYKETKKKKGKVIVRARGKDFDLEAHSLDELKVQIESEDKHA
jgi:anti-anti-sigma regulatory factor